MANEIKLPRLGQGMESGTIVKWLKSEGDEVAKGEPLYELDTDKVTQEVEADAVRGPAPHRGRRGRGARRGDDRLDRRAGRGGRGARALDGRRLGRAGCRGSGDPPAAATDAAPAPSAPSAPSGNGAGRTSVEGGRIKASPLARRIARERGIELAQIQGTGPEGRIVAEDVERAAAQPRPAAPAAGPVGEVETIPLTNIRKTIARRLTAAWEAPVFQLTVSADMGRANEVVARSRELNPDVRVTVTDLLAKVSAMALMRHAAVNVQYRGRRSSFPTRTRDRVAAPQGLVVRSCAVGRLRSPSGRCAESVGRARDNKLHARPEGGTSRSRTSACTASSSSSPSSTRRRRRSCRRRDRRPRGRREASRRRPMMTMTLTVDHRAVDGATGGRFLRTLKTFVEDPALAL
jgi:pyruvate dehydrogenase E2 component (dihydrolipoamide acetyltransferase)